VSARALRPSERDRLRRLLDEHRPADDEEERDRRFIRDFVDARPNPFDRRIAEAHLTGSAFVLDPSGRLLLMHHRRLDRWLQLGGHAEGEREAADVALREAREESGLADLAFHEALRFPDGLPRLLDLDVHRIPARGDEREHLHLDLRFALRTGRPEESTPHPGEANALEWVELEEAARRGDRSLGRAVERLIALEA
jgi:ADP-ribose pyrophosphatase YjhB (NUDIX family)